MRISQAAFDLIVAEEVTSQAYYERHYQQPEWPGGLSGVTVGIGYDLGYSAKTKIKADWADHVSADMLAVMCECSGVTGAHAEAMLGRVKRAIVIPWAAAIDVFAHRDIPNWTSEVLNHIEKAADLTPTRLGVIVSIAYNRGASFDLPGDRYTEMRAIKAHINGQQLGLVSTDIRRMKRLWPAQQGLRDRRDHEAALWMKGATDAAPVAQAIAVAPPKPVSGVPLHPGPARTKPTRMAAIINTIRSWI